MAILKSVKFNYGKFGEVGLEDIDMRFNKDKVYKTAKWWLGALMTNEERNEPSLDKKINATIVYKLEGLDEPETVTVFRSFKAPIPFTWLTYDKMLELQSKFIDDDPDSVAFFDNFNKLFVTAINNAE